MRSLPIQVKRDLTSGRLVAPISTVCLLASYAVQSTLGDFDPDSCRTGYLTPFQVNLPSHHRHHHQAPILLRLSEELSPDAAV